MGRRLLTELREDVAVFTAVLTAFAFALATWRCTGYIIVRARGAPPADGSTEPLAPPTDSARIDSAQVDKAPAAPPAAPPEATNARTYNVLLVTVDTLRADIGYAGYPRPVTPHIDALAQHSIVYEHAYAMASFTPKSVGPMLIGRYSSETHRDFEHYTYFGPANVFLAERVRDAGGRTCGAATHRYFGLNKGLAQGFDVWDTSAIPPAAGDNDPTITSETLTNVAIGLLSSKDATKTPALGDKGARSGSAAKHFFAWFHYLDPHLPYVPHEGAPAFGKMDTPGIPRARDPYDAEVWFTDEQIGRLLRHVGEQPWANETAIILTADHGEAFGEHNHWGHGRELWEPLVHVPLLVFVPGIAPRHIHAKRSHIDIVPTVLELMGIPRVADLHGTSLLADTNGAPDGAEERDVYIDMPEGPFNEMRRAVITGPSPGVKLIDFGAGRYELYDLAADPLETTNLARQEPARVAESKEAMTRVRAGLKELPPSK
jgi:arylsulfatase A-like enzyme